MHQDWLLLLHQIPPKPPYFRAQTARRLEKMGALQVKNSAYMLPESEESLEDFQWICREIMEQGGNSWLFRAEALAGLTDEQIRARFQELRASDYEELIREANDLATGYPGDSNTWNASLARLRRRFREIRKIDFFDAPEHRTLELLMTKLEKLSQEETSRVESNPGGDLGRTWVTRKGVKVDRISSAWLIRRFIDQEAVFRFVDPNDYMVSAGETRFDMYDGEFTHDGDLCTFEVLLRSLNATDPALAAIAEIVHDIDLKDQKYQHPESAGFERFIVGLCRQTASDEERLRTGAGLLDALYEGFRAV
jgi:hypothetical protein